MNDAAVVAGLVSCDFPLFVEDQKPGSGALAKELQTGGEADNAGPDDRDVPLFISHGQHGLSPRWGATRSSRVFQKIAPVPALAWLQHRFRLQGK
jgi:hypothetical protein